MWAAVNAVRSWLRGYDIDPAGLTPTDALWALDYMNEARTDARVRVPKKERGLFVVAFCGPGWCQPGLFD